MDRRSDPNPNYVGNPASVSANEDHPLDQKESECSATVLRYINQILMEEETEEKTRTLHDSLALQAAEKSFYEVIGEKYPSTPSSSYPNVDSPEDSLSGTFSSDYSGSSGSSYGTSTRSSAESPWSNVDPTEYNNPSSSNSGYLGTSMAGFLDSTTYVMQIQRGVEQTSKFLPKNSIFIDPGNTTFSPSCRMALREVEIKPERDEWPHFPAESSRGRKTHEWEYEAETQDGRSNKHSAIDSDSVELSELFDKFLVLGSGLRKEEPPNSSGGGKSRVRKQGNEIEVVDLRTLLTQCARAISSDSLVTANELLKQIKQHSSPIGDGTRRLAHYFGNALEARLAGTGSQIYSAISSKRTSISEMVKAYQMYSSACPFEKLAVIFTLNSIANVAKEAETLHIIDFGILYGFKWPSLIHRLSKRNGGPPKLRITGIEFPQPGFKPEERVIERRRRLAMYCSRFNVPFEYHSVIAQKWEAIKIEDLKLKKNEVVVVNCMFRFENLLDETVVLNNPRDAVLNLIRKTNPSIFVHGIVNGCYDAPFFVTRFREALFHYSALFDMLDTNVGREDPMRLMYEEEIFGRRVMNVIACEGSERVERPQTYKQWQVRNMRNGFKQVPLDPQVMKKLREWLRSDGYHSDFMLAEEGNWMLQGWKGRILHASSCWVPA